MTRLAKKVAAYEEGYYDPDDWLAAQSFILDHLYNVAWDREFVVLLAQAFGAVRADGFEAGQRQGDPK